MLVPHAQVSRLTYPPNKKNGSDNKEKCLVVYIIKGELKPLLASHKMSDRQKVTISIQKIIQIFL